MPLHLLRAEKADIPQLVDVYFNTFKSPLVLRLKPDVPPVREWYHKCLESDTQEPHTRIYKVVEGQAEVAQGSDEIIAFAKWNLPLAKSPQEKPIDWPVDGDVELFKEVIGKAKEKRKCIMGDKKYWCKCLAIFKLVLSISRHSRPRNPTKASAQRRGIIAHGRILQAGG
jgi:hypothetical protein